MRGQTAFRLIIIFLLFFTGCSAHSTNERTTAQPTKIEQISATYTPSSTMLPPAGTGTATQQVYTPTATITSAPEIPFFPVPTHMLSEEGPWGVVPAKNGLWVMQADGSGLTRVYEGGSILQLAISPDGKMAAFISQLSKPRAFSSDLTLYLITLPGWKPRLIASLDPKDTEKFSTYDFIANTNAREAGNAMLEATSLAWSPDGRYLAFISAHEGASADVYVYVASTGEIRRLTDGPSQAYGLSWSPDSQYIFHSGTDFFGTGAGHGITGAWVVSVDEDRVTQVLPAEFNDVRAWNWATNDTMLVSNSTIACIEGNKDLREINIKSGVVKMLWPSTLRRKLQAS